MVIIHLAKLSILEKSCNHFKQVLIPQEVYQEVLRGKEKLFPETSIIAELIKNKKILVKRIKEGKLVKKERQKLLHYIGRKMPTS